jgi:hypothetical protein
MIAIAIAIAVIVQIAAAGVLVFGDIGFDFPGRYGLDFGHAILLVVLYLIALVVGVAICLFKKNKVGLGVQAGILVLIVGYHIFPRPDPMLDAAKYQHLIGKSKSEAQSVLGGYRMRVSGIKKDAGAAEGLEFEGYNGLTIYYSVAGNVVKVESRNN